MTETSAKSATSLRADKWLWHARLVKTRTLAAKIIGDGRLRVNGRRATKPSAPVRPEDVLTVAIHGRVRVLRILEVGTRRGPATEAQALYKDLSPAPEPRGEPAEIASGPRPTKRERRQRDKLHRFNT